MHIKLRTTVFALGAMAATAFAAPALAGNNQTPMQQGRPGQMMGNGGMGMMGGGMMGNGGYGYGRGRPGMMGQGYGNGMMGQGYGNGMMGPGYGMGNGGMMGGGMGMGMQTMHALNLNRSQVNKMAQVHQNLAQKGAGMSADMQKLRWELYQEMAKDRPDPDKVGDLYEQMAQKRKAMIEERVRARNELLGTLNDQQRKQYRQMMENMRHMGQGGGYGYGNMPMYQNQNQDQKQ